MEAVNAKGTICAGRMEYPCRIRLASDTQVVVLLERNSSVSGNVIVVDHKNGTAMDAKVGQVKGQELTLSVHATTNLAGLVPARLGRARDIWKRT